MYYFDENSVVNNWGQLKTILISLSYSLRKSAPRYLGQNMLVSYVESLPKWQNNLPAYSSANDIFAGNLNPPAFAGTRMTNYNYYRQRVVKPISNVLGFGTKHIAIFV